MAIELFQPFLIRELRKKIVKQQLLRAKKLIQKQDPIIWKVLQQNFTNSSNFIKSSSNITSSWNSSFSTKIS